MICKSFCLKYALVLMSHYKTSEDMSLAETVANQ